MNTRLDLGLRVNVVTFLTLSEQLVLKKCSKSWKQSVESEGVIAKLCQDFNIFEQEQQQQEQQQPARREREITASVASSATAAASSSSSSSGAAEQQRDEQLLTTTASAATPSSQQCYSTKSPSQLFSSDPEFGSVDISLIASFQSSLSFLREYAAKNLPDHPAAQLSQKGLYPSEIQQIIKLTSVAAKQAARRNSEEEEDEDEDEENQEQEERNENQAAEAGGDDEENENQQQQNQSSSSKKKSDNFFLLNLWNSAPVQLRLFYRMSDGISSADENGNSIALFSIFGVAKSYNDIDALVILPLCRALALAYTLPRDWLSDGFPIGLFANYVVMVACKDFDFGPNQAVKKNQIYLTRGNRCGILYLARDLHHLLSSTKKKLESGTELAVTQWPRDSVSVEQVTRGWKFSTTSQNQQRQQQEQQETTPLKVISRFARYSPNNPRTSFVKTPICNGKCLCVEMSAELMPTRSLLPPSYNPLHGMRQHLQSRQFCIFFAYNCRIWMEEATSASGNPSNASSSPGSSSSSASSSSTPPRVELKMRKWRMYHTAQAKIDSKPDDEMSGEGVIGLYPQLIPLREELKNDVEKRNQDCVWEDDNPIDGVFQYASGTIAPHLSAESSFEGEFVFEIEGEDGSEEVDVKVGNFKTCLQENKDGNVYLV